MIKKFMIVIIILIITVNITACKIDERTTKEQAQEVSGQNITPSAPGFVLEEVKYEKDGISGSYPRIISGASDEKLSKLNQIIEKDFNKILGIYAFNPFPELTSTPTNPVIILNISDEIKLNNGRYLSIFYKAAYNSKYSAHPSELVYTTNIDMENAKRLKLSDMVKPDAGFIKFIRNGNLITFEQGNKDIDAAIKDYISNMSDKDMLKGFETADIIGSGNVWGIFSYLTPDSLGVSISVPYYAGDHVEIETKYSELTNILKLTMD